MARQRSYLSQVPYQAKYRLKRVAFVNDLKSQPCMDCGGTFPPECMDFDHRSGTVKVFSIGLRMNGSLETLRREIAKCDLVCANCHRIRTTSRKREAVA